MESNWECNWTDRPPHLPPTARPRPATRHHGTTNWDRFTSEGWLRCSLRQLEVEHRLFFFLRLPSPSSDLRRPPTSSDFALRNWVGWEHNGEREQIGNATGMEARMGTQWKREQGSRLGMGTQLGLGMQLGLTDFRLRLPAPVRLPDTTAPPTGTASPPRDGYAAASANWR